MCTTKVVWQPLMTSPSLCLPPSCLSCRPSIRHTSSSPTVSGNRRSVRSVSEGPSCRNNDAFSRIEMSSKASPEAACQLDSRYWKITTSDGNVEEVQGPGVVGTLLRSRDHLQSCDWLFLQVDRVGVCRRVPGHETWESPWVLQLHHLLHPLWVHGGSLHLPPAG